MQWERSLRQPFLSFFLSLCDTLTCYMQRSKSALTVRCSGALTITKTQMEDTFEIKEGGVKERRI